VERLVGRALFASRWVAAPLYPGLVLALVILLLRFAVETWELLINSFSLTEDGLIVAVLSLVDLSLVANLVVMVVFAGYENFVTSLVMADDPARPRWMGHIGFGELKVKLMTSIVAISAIHVLENFMEVDHLTNHALGWSVGLHLAFVLTALVLTVMDRLESHP
jgi:uncharacterized protein (TIGR00645 family)